MFSVLRRSALIALVASVTALSCYAGYLAYDTVARPSLGILPFQNLYVGAFSLAGPDGQSDLGYHDRVRAVDGRAVHSGDELRALVEKLPAEREVTIEIRRPGGERTRLQRAPRPLAGAYVYRTFTPLLATGISFLILSIMVLLIRPSPRGLVPFVLYCSATAAYLLCAFDFHTTYRLVYPLFFAISFMPATILHLALHFPGPILSVPRRRRIVFLGYAAAAAIFAPYARLFGQSPGTWVRWEYAVFFYVSGAYLFWVWSMLYRIERDPDALVRRQSRSILFALVVGFGSIFVLMWANFLFHVPIPLTLVVPFCLSFPMTIVVAMFRSNLFLVERLEIEVRERTERLRQKEVELLQTHKLASVGLLASGTAHEIGNAMNVIAANLPVLQRYADGLVALIEGTADKGAVDYANIRADLGPLLSDVRKGSERVLEIMKNLRNFARPETLQRTETPLVAAVETTLNLLKTRIPQGVRIERALDPLPPVQAVSGQIHQVLLNLLLNACDAVRPGGRITVRTRAEGGNAVIEIEDDGPGIPLDVLPRIFDPFFTTKASGTGLGLSVSYGIVRDHGGRISVRSDPNAGTRFTVTLPFGVESAA